MWNVGPRSWQCEPSAVTEGPSCPVSKLFIIWHSVSDSKMHCLSQFLHQEFPDLQDNKNRSENVCDLHPSL